jgi:hypothetical protein
MPIVSKHFIRPVILSVAPERFVSNKNRWRGVEGSRGCFPLPCRLREFLPDMPFPHVSGLRKFRAVRGTEQGNNPLSQRDKDTASGSFDSALQISPAENVIDALRSG